MAGEEMSDMKPSEVLDGVLNILSEPERWTKGANARDARRREVDIADPRATCWCIHGALLRVSGPVNIWPHCNASYDALGYLYRVIRKTESAFNDAPVTTFNMVQDALQKARDMALAEGN